MPNVAAIAPYLWTSSDKNSGTDSRVFLGIGGREFRLNTKKDDFKKGGFDVPFIFGSPPTSSNGAVLNPEKNHPTTPYPLETERLDRFPVYLRLDGDDHWKLQNVIVSVLIRDESQELVADRSYTTDRAIQGGMWLGPDAGQTLYLVQRTIVVLSNEFDLTKVVREMQM